MRLFSILALTTLLSAPAFAADLGTYRPGSPYHSVVAAGADVCESHCTGDAQCKGWNYVKVNRRAPGVCEFNAKAVSPIESVISISGGAAAGIAPNLTQGSTNTIRVGTSSAPKSNTVTVGRTPSGRRIVRKAVPQRVNPQQTATRRGAASGSLTEQQNRYRQATGHAAPQTRQAPQNRPALQQQAARPQAIPQGQRLMRDPRIQQRQQQRAPQAPRFQHNLDGGAHPIMARPNMQAPQQRPQGQSQGRPPIGMPIGQQQQKLRRQAQHPQNRPQAAIPRGSVNSPVTNQNAPERLRAAEMAAAQRQAQMQQMSVEQAQESLFGNLNDDVKAPKPLVNLPKDPEAPIATMQSRPTVPVSEEPLGALAGAPRR